MADLGSLGEGTAFFDASSGNAVNDKGQVAGKIWYLNAIGPHACLFTDGQIIDLGTFGGTTSEGLGINHAGHVVGYATLPSDQAYHAFIYTSGEGMTDLNTLIPSESGWVLQVAQAINNRDEIVGYGMINGKSRAFLLKPVN